MSCKMFIGEYVLKYIDIEPCRGHHQHWAAEIFINGDEVSTRSCTTSMLNRWYTHYTQTCRLHYLLFVRIYDLKDASVISVNLHICVLWCICKCSCYDYVFTLSGINTEHVVFTLSFIGHVTYFGGKVKECHRWWLFPSNYDISCYSFLGGNQMHNDAFILFVLFYLGFIFFFFQYCIEK